MHKSDTVDKKNVARNDNYHCYMTGENPVS